MSKYHYYFSGNCPKHNKLHISDNLHINVLEYIFDRVDDKKAENLLTSSFWLGQRCFACKLQPDLCFVSALLPIKPK